MMNISHFFLCVIRIDFTRHCEGIWKPWYQHYIMKRSLSWKSLSAQHQQWHRHFFFFFFFLKNRASISNTPQYFFYIYIYFFQLFSINITLMKLFISLQFPTHSFRGINSVLFNDWTFGSTCLRTFQEN